MTISDHYPCVQTAKSCSSLETHKGSSYAQEQEVAAVEYVSALDNTSEYPGLSINFPYICSASNVIWSRLITEYKCGTFIKLSETVGARYFRDRCF